jgi:hypothetical protein
MGNQTGIVLHGIRYRLFPVEKVPLNGLKMPLAPGNIGQHTQPLVEIPMVMHCRESRKKPWQGVAIEADGPRYRPLLAFESLLGETEVGKDRAFESHFLKKTGQTVGMIVMTVTQGQTLSLQKVKTEFSSAFEKKGTLPDVPKPLVSVAQSNKRRQAMLAPKPIGTGFVVAQYANFHCRHAKWSPDDSPQSE